MGDMADWCIDQEIETASLHAAGRCDDWCPYCLEEEAKREDRRNRRKAATQRARERRARAEERHG